MKKIFIDGGGHDGCTVRKLLKENKDYQIYSFECNPKFFSYYKKLPTTLIKKAIWVEDCTKQFFMQRSAVSGGSSLFKKVNLGGYKVVNIECIDFSKWVLDNFNIDDYIILKLDIEGAEYSVLEKMLEDKSFDYVNEFFVEWHQHKLVDKNVNHDLIIEKISKKVKVEYWDAIDERIIR